MHKKPIGPTGAAITSPITGLGEAADDSQQHLIFRKRHGQLHEAEGRDSAISGIGGGRTEPGEQADRRPFLQGAADAQKADRAHGRRDHQPDHRPLRQQNQDVHRPIGCQSTIANR